jgi:glycosyltransferase involved in cell wall biosynthesis
LAQTCWDFELIVVDDGSTDDTRQVVTGFEDPRIRYVYQANAGAADARNAGVASSSGKYVTFLDSDDEALPNWLEHFAYAFNELGADVVCCGVERVGELAQSGRDPVLLPRDYGAAFAHQSGLFTQGGTFALRKELFEAIGGYASGLASGQNTELALRLLPCCAEKGWRIHNVFIPLIKYHLHTAAHIRRNPRAVYEGTMYILRHHRDRLAKAPRLLGTYWAVAAVNAARMAEYGKARYCLRKAIWAYPWKYKFYAHWLLTWIPSLGKRIWYRGANSAL